MHRAQILDIADQVEQSINEFLGKNNGGRFILPELENYFLVIPLMISVFEEKGWEVKYDYNDENEWLDFEPLKLLCGDL